MIDVAGDQLVQDSLEIATRLRAELHQANRGVAHQERCALAHRFVTEPRAIAPQQPFEIGGRRSAGGDGADSFQIAQRPEHAAGAVVERRLDAIAFVAVAIERMPRPVRVLGVARARIRDDALDRCARLGFVPREPAQRLMPRGIVEQPRIRLQAALLSRSRSALETTVGATTGTPRCVSKNGVLR